MTSPNSDLSALMAEARSDGDTAQRILEAYAARVQTLQSQTDELRAENALLRRAGGSQTVAEQVQRLRAQLRDLRRLAEAGRLNRDVVTLLNYAGQGVHLPAPAPIEQTLPLALPPGESVGALRPLFLNPGSLFGSVLVITSGLRLALAYGPGLPVSENWDWRDARPAAGLDLARAERVEAACAVDEWHPPRSVMLVSRQGWARIMSWTLVENLAVSGQSITLPGEGDSPVWLGPYDGEGDLLLVTRNGRWTRLPSSLVTVSGIACVDLEPNDDVACAAILRAGDPVVLFASADGALVPVAAEGLPAHKRLGVKPAPLTRRLVALACFPVNPRKAEVALALTQPGVFHVVTMKGLRVAARPSEAQPLNVINQRLAAVARL